MTKQPNNRYSIDGFVSGGQRGMGARHVGFDAPRQHGANGAVQRIRRPAPPMMPAASAGQGPGLERRQAADQRRMPQGFTSYTPDGALPQAAPLPAGGRQRGRHGRAVRGKHARDDPGRRRVSWKKIFKRTLLVIVLFALVTGGWLGWKFFSTTSKVFGGDASVLGFLNSTKLKGEDKGQVNILLAGVSTDDAGHQGAELADSIMLISLDTRNNKAMMMSVPRDLWVEVPNYGHSKINAANAYGEQDHFSEAGYPDGGMGLLEKTVSDTFDVPINYYARINYSAFRDAVNAVGGVTVDIRSSDPRGLYDPNISKAEGGPLKLPNGVQTLDGQTALNLARARGDPPPDGRIPYGFERSDFTRTEHQRMMLLALKEKMSSTAVISNPLKLGQLFDVIGKNMKTDFQPSEIRRLYDLNKQIKSSDIASISLNDINGKNLLANYRTADGASALIPAAGLDDFSDINIAVKKMLSSDPVVKESAKIVILNGGGITGMASKESNNLTSKGLNVVAIGDAPKQEGGNVIIDRSKGKMPATKAKLQQIYKASVASDDNVGYPTADLIVILGTNHRPQGADTSEDE